jgi:hypothetical protein
MITTYLMLKGCEGIGDQLEQRRASFEASLREAPQDEDISKCYQRRTSC